MNHRPTLLLLALAALSTAGLAADAKKQTEPKPMIGSTVFNWDKLTPKTTANGERRDVANNPTPTLAVFECHITTLNPGKESHPQHQHPQEELIIIKEGTLEVHFNGHTQVAGPGSTLFYSSMEMHNVVNVGTTRATYWVVNVATGLTQNPALQNKSPKLQSAVYDYQKLEVKPSKVGEGRRVLDGSTVTMKNLETHITAVNPGEAPHAPHRHPDEEIILIREGTLEININGQMQRAGAGSVAILASNDLHGWRNVGTTRAEYHVIRILTEATPKAVGAEKKK